MLTSEQIEKLIVETQKKLDERAKDVINQDRDCIALGNQIQAYSRVLNPPPNMEVKNEVSHEADPTAEA